MDRQLVILHVDMDAFYASVEQRDDPSLVGKPVIVGGLGRRGVVSTCSYEARRFGVRSAMPSAQAHRLCPQGIFLPPRMARYAEVSAQVFEVLAEITPVIESLSLDEAFLDVGDSQKLFGSAIDMAARIKRRVLETTELKCSVGVSHNKWLAKLATELGKPDGLFEINKSNREMLLDPLSVGRLWTVGKVAQEKLERAGYRTIGDVRRAQTTALRRVVGNHAELLQALANGDDHRAVVSDREDQSVGAETTFDVDLSALAEARVWLLKLCERVGERTRRHRLCGRVVTIKLRTPPFHTETRQVTLATGTDSTDVVHSAARQLLERWWKEQTAPQLRLLGVSLGGFGEVAGNQDLFADASSPKKDRLADTLNEKFGSGTLKRARSLARSEEGP